MHFVLGGAFKFTPQPKANQLDLRPNESVCTTVHYMRLENSLEIFRYIRLDLGFGCPKSKRPGRPSQISFFYGCLATDLWTSTFLLKQVGCSELDHKSYSEGSTATKHCSSLWGFLVRFVCWVSGGSTAICYAPEPETSFGGKVSSTMWYTLPSWLLA